MRNWDHKDKTEEFAFSGVSGQVEPCFSLLNCLGASL